LPQVFTSDLLAAMRPASSASDDNCARGGKAGRHRAGRRGAGRGEAARAREKARAPGGIHAPRTHLLELIRHEVHDQRKVLHFGALVADVVNACARGERGRRGRARAAEEAVRRGDARGARIGEPRRPHGRRAHARILPSGTPRQ
jgi:hypothetical protein